MWSKWLKGVTKFFECLQKNIQCICVWCFSPSVHLRLTHLCIRAHEVYLQHTTVSLSKLWLEWKRDADSADVCQSSPQPVIMPGFGGCAVALFPCPVAMQPHGFPVCAVTADSLNQIMRRLSAINHISPVPWVFQALLTYSDCSAWI